jgi:2-haloacid dehalogenase
MAPSKSSLDRLPKAPGARWEEKRETYEQVLREAIVVPDETSPVAVSIDGVLAPVGRRWRERHRGTRQGCQGRSLEQRDRILVFDVNETLLDITVLEPLFVRLFREARVLQHWFAELVLYSEAFTLSALRGLCRGRCRRAEDGAGAHDARRCWVQDGDAHELAAQQREEPARQRRAGPHFERRFSVDTSVKRFKPAPQTYAFVAQSLGVELDALRLVAAHAWDATAAMAAGCASAIVTRAGNAPVPVGPQADVVSLDLTAVARGIIEIDR